ncbi:hypothetical protein pb186bvf_006591 [Paramecium bursaria]
MDLIILLIKIQTILRKSQISKYIIQFINENDSRIQWIIQDKNIVVNLLVDKDKDQKNQDQAIINEEEKNA